MGVQSASCFRPAHLKSPLQVAAGQKTFIQKLLRESASVPLLLSQNIIDSCAVVLTRSLTRNFADRGLLQKLDPEMMLSSPCHAPRY